MSATTKAQLQTPSSGSGLASAMREDYNANSKVQQANMVSLSKRFIDIGLESHCAALKPDNVPALTVADFGSSTGANSSVAVSMIIQGLRKKYGFEATKSISVIHSDLPSNSWSTFFQFINDNENSYGNKHEGVYPTALGRSFYEQILPPNSLHFGYSNYSLHWLSRLPTKITNHCIYLFGTEEERRAFRKVAQQDWAAFLKARSVELASGGVLVLHVLSTRQPKPVPSDAIYMSAKRLLERGFITEEEMDNFNYQIYFRTLEEVSDTALLDSLNLELIQVEELLTPNPIYEAYKQHQDLDRYAAEFTDYLGGALEPTFRDALENHREKQWLSELLWFEYKTFVKQRPHYFANSTGHIFVVLRKK